MKKIIFSFMLLALIFSFTSSANAISCGKSGYIIRVTVYPGTSSSYIYYNTSALSSSYMYCSTSDAKLLDAANDALTGRSYTAVYSNSSAATCPTSGNMGTCTAVVVSP